MTNSKLNFSEKGRDPAGEPTQLDRRMFMQLQCFTGCDDLSKIRKACKRAKLPAVLYQDLSDPKGFGLLTYSERPEFFVNDLRKLLTSKIFEKCVHKPSMTMTGRTYSIGYENNLEYVLLKRPIERVLQPDAKWAVWYPLRRKGEFEKLDDAIQRDILKEHGDIGFAFSAAGYGQDVRLACHGLDTNDNDFVIGILGPELAPLSSLVQRMRKTAQTSQYLEKLGPFFIGNVVWQSAKWPR